MPLLPLHTFMTLTGTYFYFPFRGLLHQMSGFVLSLFERSVAICNFF